MCLWASRLLAVLLGHVAAVVEVSEESDEAERVGQHHHVHGVGEVAVGVQVVGGVAGHSEELQLQTQVEKLCSSTVEIPKYFVLNHVSSIQSGGLRKCYFKLILLDKTIRETKKRKLFFLSFSD